MSVGCVVYVRRSVIDRRYAPESQQSSETRPGPAVKHSVVAGSFNSVRTMLAVATATAVVAGLAKVRSLQACPAASRKYGTFAHAQPTARVSCRLPINLYFSD